MAKQYKWFNTFKRSIKRKADKLGIVVSFIPPGTCLHCGMQYGQDVNAARKINKSGKAAERNEEVTPAKSQSKTCAMSDGIILTEGQIVEQLRLTMKESTSGWNPTSVKSVILIMRDDGLGQETKKLAEDCLMKFIFETCGHKLSDAVPPKALRRMLRKTPKEKLLGLVTRCVNVFDRGIAGELRRERR